MNRYVKLFYGRFLKLLKDIFRRSMEDQLTGIGAQMSYYFILAFFPFLIFLIAALSYTNITGEDVLQNLRGYLPPDVYAIVMEFIKNTISGRSRTILSFGAITTLWVASNGIESLTYGINAAYDFKETRPYWKLKSVCILFTFAIAVVYIFSLVMVVFGGILVMKLLAFFKLSGLLLYLIQVSRYVVPILTLFIVCLIVYHYLPAKRVGLKKIIPGAVFATCCWMLISQLFSYYITNFGGAAEAYGNLGSIIVLLLWLYWCSIAMMIGAELNASLYHFRTPRKKRMEAS